MTETKKEWIRTIKFVLFSASAGIIQIATDAFCNEVLKFAPWLSHLIALILSVLWNFTLNRKFTFHSANNITLAMIKVALFYAVFTPLSTWWTAVLTEKAGWNEYLVLGITMLINFVSEYIFQRFAVYGKSVDTAFKTDAKRQEENV